MGHLAMVIGGGIERELNAARVALTVLARHPDFQKLKTFEKWGGGRQDAPEQAEPLLREALRTLNAETGHFTLLFIARPDGSGYLAEPFSVQQVIKDVDFSERAYFQEVARTLKPVVSDSLQGKDGVPSVVIDVPLLDTEGRLVGHLGGVLHLDHLSTLVSPQRVGHG